MTFDETDFLSDVAQACARHRYNESKEANAQAVGKLLQAAAAVLLGAVDKGWTSKASAREMFTWSAGGAFDVVRESSAKSVDADCA